MHAACVAAVRRVTAAQSTVSASQPKRDDRIARFPCAAAAEGGGDELFASGLITDRRRFHARFKIGVPQFAAGVYIVGMEPAVERGADEHQAAARDDRTAEIGRTPVGMAVLHRITYGRWDEGAQ